MLCVARNAGCVPPAPFRIDLELVLHVPVGEHARLRVKPRFLGDLPQRSLAQSLAFVLTAGHRLPESGPIRALEQQHLQVGRVDHHQYRHRDLVLFQDLSPQRHGYPTCAARRSTLLGRGEKPQLPNRRSAIFLAAWFSSSPNTSRILSSSAFSVPLWLIWFCAFTLSQADVEFAQLFLVHRAGGFAHEVLRALGFRESDHVAYRIGTGHHGYDAVESERQTAVRRRAELKGVEQEAEFLPCLFGLDAQCTEHLG